MVHRIAHRVASADTLAFWEDRLGERRASRRRAWTARLRFADPEGLEHELVVVDVPDPPLAARSTEVPDEHALLGFHAVDAAVANPRKTEALLRETLGFTDRGDGHWEARGEQRGGSIRLEAAGGRGFGGAGTIHHIAWATTFDEHSAWREHVAAAGYSDHRGDRPLLLPLGRTSASRAGSCSSSRRSARASRTDEPLEALGERLSLPPDFEKLREQVEPLLTPLPDVRQWRPAPVG